MLFVSACGNWTVRLRNTLPTGQFAYETFRLVDSLPIEQFAY